MFFDRPAKQDINAWHELQGLAALGPIKWNWNGLYPYFKKSVTFTEPSPAVASQYGYTWDVSAYGGSGPIYSTYATFQWADERILAEAWRDLGIQDQQECADGSKEGICWVPASQHPITGARSHAGIGHYQDVQPRSNYDLLVKHQVIRVVYGPGGPLSGSAPKVEVRSLDDDSRFNVTVTGEVIISAGAIHTPTVLQRSGIGQASFLSSRGIPVVVDLPGVGANFQDHSGPSVRWNYTEEYAPGLWPLSSEMAKNATFKAEAIAAFAQTPADGPYTLAGGNSAIYVSLPHLAGQTVAKQIARKIRQQVLTGAAASFLPRDLRTSPTIVAGYAAQLLVLAKLLEDPNSPSLETPWAMSEGPVTAWNFLLHPLSRGTVRLNPTDPLEPPILDYRAATNPVDMDLHRAHVRFLRQVIYTPTLQQFGAIELGPGASVAADDDDLAEYIQQNSLLSFMHPCCTAAMMPRLLGGVVGTDLKVHGTKRLRVVDASIIPLNPAAHLSATVYAIAEKVGDLPRWSC
jgi:choline dehydrogenase